MFPDMAAWRSALTIFHWRAAFGLAVLLSTVAAASINAVDKQTSAAFQMAAAAELASATVEFERLHGQKPGDRSITLGRALTLAGRQPRTERNLLAAAKLLDDLMAGPADALAAEAAYHRTRLVQALAGTTAAEVEPSHRAVWENFPGTLQAERAFVLHAIGRQHAPMSLAERHRELIRLDTQAEALLTRDSPRRMYHLAASTAWARLAGNEARARDHLLVVHALGLADDYGYSNVIARLAEYHRRAGDNHGALRFYREFLERYPSDRRTDMISRWVNRLEADIHATR